MPLRLLVPLLLLAATAPAEKLSVFERVQVDGDTIRVRLEGRDYLLVAIDGFDTSRLIPFCREKYGDSWPEQFSLRLVEVLTALRGSEPPDSISVVVRREDTGQRTVVEKAPMTRANWRKIFWARQGFGRAIEPPRLDRKITRDQALSDLRQLDRALTDRFAYLGRIEFERKPNPFPEGPTVTIAQLKRIIARHLAQYSDPNTYVPGLLAALPGNFLPFTVRPVGDRRIAAIDRDGNRPLNRLAPYLAALDSRRPQDWMRGLRPYLADGTLPYIRYAGTELVAKFDAVRRAAGTRTGPDVWVTLESEDREVRVRVRMNLSDVALVEPKPTDIEMRMLEGKIGCVPLPHMEGADAFRRQIEPILPHLRESRALVLDLRGNASSNRELLRVLLTRLVPRGSAPRVVNVAHLRVSGDGDAGDDLSRYGLHPADFPGWSAGQKAAIDAFAETFEPEWKVPADRFTPPCYMVVGPPKEGDAEDGYGNPVAILIDGATRNDAEVLAAALKGQPGITLVGEPTGGSDGWPELLVLDNSGIQVSISTVVSFRPDGKLFNGNSVEPDVPVWRIPTDWTGQTDTQLDAARKVLAE